MVLIAAGLAETENGCWQLKIADTRGE